MLLEGKVAIITGAASGIGRGAAMVFARHGARLVLGDIDEAGGEETAKAATEAGTEALFVRTDVTSASDVEAMVRTAMDRFGGLDCAFNNAGIEGAQQPLAESTEDTWDQVNAVNLKGVWLCLRSEVALMLRSGGGAIVNTSSVAGLVGIPFGLSAYTASKHGVIGLTKAAALEYATAGIRVNAICPGGIRTAMFDRALSAGIVTVEQAAALQPVNRLGTPEEVGQTVAWLCSDESSFITGHAMAVDGGYVAR
ncbi:MAG TPA: SDR family oxidoreductase [Actinophytocola sp.]|uniref:SDR family oxidoreductase n=1 Tax=Actinophytocola sp. TaxID=1872138 RepID=UPI002DDD1222|nr:SDR family oxidoreductase [Actinophytocola sp.]HEV2784244.1 SDR family oxidoreductase [Actinophytocola sp.]